MRVFQLNTFCGVKSTGRICTEIAKLVEKDGGACRIGFGAGKPPKELERYAYRIGTPIERKLYSAARKVFDLEGYGAIPGTYRLVEELKAFQADIVHLHNLHGCYLNLSILFRYLRAAGTPVLWTLHDCWPFTGHCAYFDYAGCKLWQTGCHDCPQLRSYPVCYGLDGSKRNYAHKKSLFTSLSNLTFVTPCEWMQAPLKHSFLSPYPVKTIYNGVDLEAFHPIVNSLRTRYGLEDKKVVLSVASDWDERKGLRFLVEAAKRMGSDYRFVVIGLTQAQVESLPPSMLGVCHTSDVQELAAWYTTADCLANPTLEDNMPMVNLESLACGTPVAVFRTGGCPEAIEPSCGCVVEKGDVDGLCTAIQELCGHKSMMEQACIEQAKRFDSQKTFQRYLEVYKELCP
ncbi:MAG: glycosyltransferase [Eubacteriales bacterium]|nr:glycosyltransferase [Eubacteriales bacterium]